METGGNENVYFTKEPIYLLKNLHTSTLTLKAAPVGSNESLSMDPPRNMMCVRLAVCGLGFIRRQLYAMDSVQKGDGPWEFLPCDAIYN
jgi:hypothetical protein